jgi:hypothetical protein
LLIEKMRKAINCRRSLTPQPRNFLGDRESALEFVRRFASLGGHVNAGTGAGQGLGRY